MGRLHNPTKIAEGREDVMSHIPRYVQEHMMIQSVILYGGSFSIQRICEKCDECDACDEGDYCAEHYFDVERGIGFSEDEVEYVSPYDFYIPEAIKKDLQYLFYSTKSETFKFNGGKRV